MRPINETRMLARWKLGRALKEVVRAPHGGDNRTITNGFWKWVKETLKIEAKRVIEAQRIGALPEEVLPKGVCQMGRTRRAAALCGHVATIGGPLLTLQLPICFEMRTLSGGLVRSAPE